ncbi:MAG: metallophosphoesterase family protein [Candidatus Hodarchaeales archaeon]
MKSSLAVISDIHANLSALRSVLTDISNKGIHRIICLGDLVGYYTQPIETIHLTLARCEKVLKGNNDHIAALGEVPEYYRKVSNRPLDWTNSTLTIRERRILHDLPTVHFIRDFGNLKKNLMFIHGGPEYPYDQYIYPDDIEEIESSFEFMELVEADVLFLGHTHVPFIHEKNGRYIVNPGSVGQPRDGDSRASYAIYDFDSNIELVRVEYDPTPTINGIKQHHFPLDLAQRLLVGK